MLNREVADGDNNISDHHYVKENSSNINGVFRRLFFLRRRNNLKISAAFFLGIGFCWVLFYCSVCSSPFSTNLLFPPTTAASSEDPELVKVLKRTAMAATGRKTVILTMINKAWVAEGSILDIFLEGFAVGNGTRELANHLIIVSLDQKAHRRCREVHRHCYALTTPGVNFTSDAAFMSEEYLLVVWRRIDFLASVLRLGYDFVSTDADILWFRNPFPRFHAAADVQLSCDMNLGNATDRDNLPNTGFTYVRSNPRTIQFYRFWHQSKDKFPGMHDQDVFNRIKFDPFVDAVGLKMWFLDTAYFGGFCQPVRDLSVACTMHANCCVGLETKVHDLRNVLEDWKRFSALPAGFRNGFSFDWKAPRVRCRG